MHPAFLVIVFNYVIEQRFLFSVISQQEMGRIFQGCNNYIMLVLFASVCVFVYCV